MMLSKGQFHLASIYNKLEEVLYYLDDLECYNNIIRNLNFMKCVYDGGRQCGRQRTQIAFVEVKMLKYNLRG